MAGIPVWTRDRFAQGGAPARIFLACFSEGPAPQKMTLDSKQHGVPGSGVPKEIQISSLTAEVAPDFFAALLQGPLRITAEQNLGNAVRKLELTRYCHRIQATIPDPPELGYLQASWALARYFVQEGAVAVLDGHAIRWTSAEGILGWKTDRPFDLTQEVTVVIETEPAEKRGHLTHTRGLVKFGRPDLLIPEVKKDQFSASHRALMSVAYSLAMGHRVSVGETISLSGAPPLVVQEYEPGVNAPDVSLNNEALLISDAEPTSNMPLKGIDRFAEFVRTV